MEGNWIKSNMVISENIKHCLESNIDLLLNDELSTNYDGIWNLLLDAPLQIKYHEYDELINVLKDLGYTNIEQLRHLRLFHILEAKVCGWQHGKCKDKKLIKLYTLLRRYTTNGNLFGYKYSDIERICLEYGQIGNLKFFLSPPPSISCMVEYIK